MSDEALAPAPARTGLAAQEMRATLLTLAAGLVLLGLLFPDEIASAVRVWIANTAYNHCFLVIPIVAYLIWDRRASLAGAVPRPWAAPALLALPVGAVWLIADRLGIMEGRQLMAMTLVELLLLTVLGWRLYFALLGPLLYLYFLVPFGDFITPALQHFTADFTTHGLNLLGIPNFTDQFTIEIPEGTFYVAEACAGLRFLIASVAFGGLYSMLMYRTPLRRGMFMLVSVVVPIIANGFRALGIVVLGHLLGSAQAAATDHVLYGWLFFSIVILMLVALGMPFRQDDRPPVRFVPGDAPGPAPRQTRFGALAGVLVLGALGPLAGIGLDRVALAAVPTAPPRLSAGGCTETSGPAGMQPSAMGRLQVQHLTCGGYGVVVRTEVLSPRADLGLILGEQRRLSDLAYADDIITDTLTEHGLRWRLRQTNEPARSAAIAFWVNGQPGKPGMALRLRQGWASVVGAHTAPVVMAIVPEPDPSGEPSGYQRARAAIVAYLEHQPDLAANVARLSTQATE